MFLILSFFDFSSIKSENRRAEQILQRGALMGGGSGEERGRRMNIM
jgi:hypothetical protein